MEISTNPEAYSEPSRTSVMELFAKIPNGFMLLTIFVKSFIIDIRLGYKYTSGIYPKLISKNMMNLTNIVSNSYWNRL